MKVYVINKDGQPLMPTDRCGKVRRMLKNKKAKVTKRCPFTIQLLYETENNTQPISLGVDAGSKTIGLSATTENEVLYEAEVQLRTDVSKLLTARAQMRRSRRNRKTRYRAPRFNNRVNAKKENRFMPSVQHKIDCHLTVINKVYSILPITEIVIETASFDIQKIKNPDIEGVEYQKSELLGYANLREYCFARDNYTCQWCKGKSKSSVLHMHHWNYWNGDHTNKPSSVITLCDVCNDSKNHKKDGFLWGWQPKITASFKDAAFMSTMRWAFYDKVKEQYIPKGISVKMTYGYITKNTRITYNLPKTHCVDARCISGHPDAKPLGYYYDMKKVRCHNRQIHKCTINKGGTRKLNQCPYEMFGYRLYDKVLCKGEEGFVWARRRSGSFKIRKLDGTVLSEGITYKKLKLLEHSKKYLAEEIKTIA